MHEKTSKRQTFALDGATYIYHTIRRYEEARLMRHEFTERFNRMMKVLISLGDLRDAITNRLKRAGNIKSLTIVNNGKDVTYLREDMIKDTWEIKQADFK